MKRITTIFIAVFIFLKITASAQDQTSDTHESILFKTNLQYGWKYDKTRFLTQELTEWSILTTAAVLDVAVVKNLLSPYENSPMTFNTNLEYKEELVSSTMELGLTASILGLSSSMILFIPNNAGFLNYEAYNNVKGYLESIVFTTLLVDTMKYSFSEKRPDYTSRLETRNDEIINDGKLSFPSQHTALAFATSVYLSLFTFQYIGDLKTPGTIALKSMFAIGINSLSFALAAERVIQNKHYVHDVVAGGFIGGLSSLFFYSLQNFFGIYKKEVANKKYQISVEPTSKDPGVKMVIRF